MLKFIGRHWRGEAGFWTSVLIFSLLVPWAVTFGGINLLSSYTIDQTPYRVMLAATLTLSLIGAHRSMAASSAPGGAYAGARRKLPAAGGSRAGRGGSSPS